MRPEKLYLLDIVEAADAIQRFCALVDEGEFRKKHNDIEWEDIVGFRNIAVHEYFAVLWQIVWNTAAQDVPDLRIRIAQILANEYQGE